MDAIASVLGLSLPDAPATAPPAQNVRDRRRAREWHQAVDRLTAHRIEHARDEARETLIEVRQAMGLNYR